MDNFFETAVAERKNQNIDKFLDFLAKAEGDPDYNTVEIGRAHV